MGPVQWNMFQQPLSADAVANATLALGELGRWWLNDSAKQNAVELDQTDYWIQKPALQSRIGSCWIVVVNPDVRTHDLLRSVFLLPLIWVRQTAHSAALPVSLRRVADDVIHTVRKHEERGSDQWGLRLAVESDNSDATAGGTASLGPNFNDLAAELFDFRSGWVALAGTLMAARRDVATNPLVWATGCWEADAGVIEVGGLEQKLRLAVEVFQIKECILLYTVPGEQSAYTRQILDMSTPAQQAVEQCASVGCKTHPIPFTYDASRSEFREELSQTIREVVEPHIQHIAPQHVAFDMHSAHKIFNYVFDHAVARPGNLMYWIYHLWFPAFRTQHPLTERFVVRRAGTHWIGPNR